MPAAASETLARLARRLEGLDRVLVEAVGQAVVEALETQMTADTGGDRSLSGVSKGRYRLTLKLSPLRNPAGVRIRPAPRQSGMWAMLDSGARPHDIAARDRRRRKGRGKGRTTATSSRGRAIGPGGQLRAGPFRHPGSRGRHTWAKGRAKGFAAGIEAARLELHRAVTGG